MYNEMYNEIFQIIKKEKYIINTIKFVFIIKKNIYFFILFHNY